MISKTRQESYCDLLVVVKRNRWVVEPSGERADTSHLLVIAPNKTHSGSLVFNGSRGAPPKAPVHSAAATLCGRTNGVHLVLEPVTLLFTLCRLFGRPVVHHILSRIARGRAVNDDASSDSYHALETASRSACRRNGHSRNKCWASFSPYRRALFHVLPLAQLPTALTIPVYFTALLKRAFENSL